MAIYRLRMTGPFAAKHPAMAWFDDSELALITDPRELKVLRLRSGLAGGKAHTLREVADIFGHRSVNVVRQLQNRAMWRICKQRIGDRRLPDSRRDV
jgi:DNA-directed RNA polymerase sigma subunit (sigma70/sigma32)